MWEALRRASCSVVRDLMQPMGPQSPSFYHPNAPVPTTDTHSGPTPQVRITFCLTPDYRSAHGPGSPSPRRGLWTVLKPRPSILINAAAPSPLTGGGGSLRTRPRPLPAPGCCACGSPSQQQQHSRAAWASGPPQAQRGDEAAQPGIELCPGRSARPRGSAHRGSPRAGQEAG